MRLSHAAEFAVRGTCVLAEKHGRGPIKLEAICRERGLAREYLAKILGSLVRAGLVTAVRGKKGGYMLARDPRRITLLDVVEAVEGPIHLNFCQEDPPDCDREDCRIRPLWTDLQEMVRARLAAQRLIDCIGNGSAHS